MYNTVFGCSLKSDEIDYGKATTEEQKQDPRTIMETRKRSLQEGPSKEKTSASSSTGFEQNTAIKTKKKKPRYSKALKKELKELRIQQEKTHGKKPDKNHRRQGNKTKKKKKTPLDDVDRILNCADQSLFTNSVLVENLDEIVTGDDSVGNNNENSQDTNGDSSRSLIVKIVSNCDVSNSNDDDDGSSPSSPTRPSPVEDPLELSSLGHRIFSRTTTITVQPLLVLDLNGILCHRDRIRKRPRAGHPQLDLRPSVGMVAKTPIIPRSDLLPFLEFLDRHFCLAIWTSARPKTAKKLLNVLLPSSETNEPKKKNKDIRNRFLFVWSQRECTAVKSSVVEDRRRRSMASATPKHPAKLATTNEEDTDLSGTLDESIVSNDNEDPVQDRDKKGTAECNNNDGNDDRSYDESIVFEKHLPKIWNAFPLWSADNTLLIDDSPKKCPFAVSNAVHPPPLHGRRKQGLQDASKHDTFSLVSDEENEALQAKFFKNLVRFWKNQPHTSSPWTATTKGIVKERTGPPENAIAETTTNKKLYEFLERNAKEYMGWRPSNL